MAELVRKFETKTQTEIDNNNIRQSKLGNRRMNKTYSRKMILVLEQNKCKIFKLVE